jgi:hypothetical protein
VAVDSLWWSVWWPWLLVWLGTVLAILAALAIAVAHWRGRRQQSRQPPYLSFYLHEQSVMALYQYKYRGALEQQVVAMVGSRAEVHMGASLPPVRFGGNVERNREEFRRYLEVAAPITVIGILMEVLEHDLVSVDLERLSILPGRNVNSLRRSSVRLSELGSGAYVLARGVFQMEATPEATGATTTFLAAYGDAGAVGRHPKLRLRCANSGLRDDVPDGQFFARCLGTVQGWDRAAGHLVINPVAIFR